MTTLTEVLSWEVRVPIVGAAAWVAGVVGAGLAVGGWVQRAAHSRRFRSIGPRAERMGP